MSDRFIDVPLPRSLQAYPCRSMPRFSTSIVGVASGAESANSNWAAPLHRFILPDKISDQESLEDFREHWMVMRGPFHTFPFRDPFDFASVRLTCPDTVPVITRTDQPLGTGDGVRRTWQLQKQYSRGPASYVRPITLPIVSTVLIGINGLEPAAVPGPSGGPYSVAVDREGGTVTFTPAPNLGLVLTAGFLYEVPVRFAGDDTFEQALRAYQMGGAAGFELMETRFC